jgi:fibronectin type 3 domain-containing protein
MNEKPSQSNLKTRPTAAAGRTNSLLRIVSYAAVFFLLVSSVSTARAFNHPGIYSPLSDMEFIKTNLNNEPWRTAFVALTNDWHASPAYTMQGPFGWVVRTKNGSNTNQAAYESDLTAAYEQSLLWYLTGNRTYATNAMNIYNAWSVTLTNIAGTDAELEANTAASVCAGAEILRYTGAGWSAANIGQFQQMLTNVFYPVIASYGVANWGGGAMQSVMAIGVFCDNTNYFNSAWAEFHAAVYSPYADSVVEYVSPSGQYQEAGRDQTHSIMALQALAGAAEIAYDQGYDGWAVGGNRLLGGYEYWCKYNLGYNDVPYDPGVHSGISWNWASISSVGRGVDGSFNNFSGISSGANMVKRAYARKGIGMPYTSQMIAMASPNNDFGWGNFTAMDTLLFATTALALPGLPDGVGAGLADLDIGSPGQVGSATYTASTTNWSVKGGGADIWGASDQFNYAYTNTPVFSTVVAHVGSVQNTAAGAKAGVMFRETLAANSAMALVDVTPGKGVEFIYRTAAGSNCAAAGLSGFTAPCWVKLVSASTGAGDQYISGYASKDGTTWRLIGDFIQFQMASNIYAGLAVCANNNSALCNANFDTTSLGLTPTNPVPAWPPAPTGLTATALPLGQVSLSWTPVSSATSYNINRSTTNGGPYLTAAYGVTGSTYTDGQMAPGQTYFYTVTALNSAGGVSADSVPASATPTVANIAGSTIVFSSTPPTVGVDSVAQLDFSGGANNGNNYTDKGAGESFMTGANATGYDLTALVFKGAGSSSSSASAQLTIRINKLNKPQPLLPVATTTASWSYPAAEIRWVTVTLGSSIHLDPNTTYEFDLQETSGSGYFGLATGTGRPYAEGYATYFWPWGMTSLTTLFFSAQGYNQTFIAQMTASAPAAPATPNGLNAAAGDAQVSLIWSASSGATSYNVKRATVNNGPYTTIANPSGTNYTDASVTNGTTYYYVVSALNAGGESTNSSQVSATPQVAAPSAPTGLIAIGGSAQVGLAWNTSSGATSYNVKRSLTSGSGYTIVTNVAMAGFTDTGVINGTNYYYVVSALNGGGESGNSTEASAMPQVPVPAAPTGLTAVPGNTQATLSWTASSGATSYNVNRSTTSGSGYVTVTNVTGTSIVNIGLTNGTTCYYVVSALNAGGESANSAQAGVTPTDLFGWWKFNETSGTTAFDSGGGGNIGTLASGATWVAGVSSNAVRLDATASGCVSFPAGLVSTLNDFSVAAFVKVNTNATWARVFDFGSGTGTYMFLAPASGGNTVRYAITTSSSGGEQQINSTAVLSPGVWHHVAVTLSGSVGVLYVDGKAIGTNSSMALKPSSLGNTAQNYIGKSQWADPNLNGSVDDFRLYARALSSTEVATLASGTLPSPWATTDVGTVSATGAADYVSGTYTIQGAGASIGGAADAFRFVYQPSSGDCSNTVRVVSIPNTGANARAGVMIRETLAAGALEAGIWVTPTNGIIFTSRNSTGGSTSTSTSAGKTAPYWLRIRRVSNSFSAYYSTNGTAWTQLGNTKNISMATSAYIGMGVCSGVSNVLNTATMDSTTTVP